MRRRLEQCWEGFIGNVVHRGGGEQCVYLEGQVSGGRG